MVKKGSLKIQLIGILLIVVGQIGFLLWGTGVIIESPVLAWIGFGVVSLLATTVGIILGFPGAK